MSNLCYICKKSCNYEVFINCEKFNNSLFYCELHKPKEVKILPYENNLKDGK